MPLPFLELSPADRTEAFVEAAARTNLSAVMIEKDFWVCWLLGQVFDQEDLAGDLVFKGGTSLSKVYGVIDRFSEDIDLSLSPASIGIEEAAFEALTSRTKRDLALQDMQQRCAGFTRDRLAPLLEQVVARQLGPSVASTSWFAFEEDAASHSPVLYYRYPAAPLQAFAYLQRAVKLELGSLTDQRPVGLHPVRPWVAEHFPQAFEGWHCEVTALELARTFWEKATILHAEYHRPAEQPMPDRYARHYADMARLVSHPQGAELLRDAALCERIVTWKSKVFARTWARYDLARRGTFRLTPAPGRAAALAADYDRMRPMFLGEPEPFAELLGQLARAEEALNAP